MGWLGWIILGVVALLAFRLIGALISGLFGGRGSGGYGPGGYGPGGYGVGGGGMFGSLMTGLFGAFAGNWLYDSFFGHGHHGMSSTAFGGEDHSHSSGFNDGAGEDFQGSGGDFDTGDHSSGGGDFGGSDGGDFGGGDFGGGDFGGGGGDF
jgi:uncharacterized protein